MTRKANRISRGRKLSPEEAAKYRELRAQVERELPPGANLQQAFGANPTMTMGDFFDLQSAVSELAKQRQAQGLSLAELQDATGIDKAALSRLESGQNLNPTISTLIRYAHALGKQFAITLRDASPSRS